MNETTKMSDLEIEKIRAEITKLMADTAKVNKDVKWYEIVIISGATLVVIAIVKLFL